MAQGAATGGLAEIQCHHQTQQQSDRSTTWDQTTTSWPASTSREGLQKRQARWTREKSTPWIAPKLTSSQVLGSGSVRREWKENGDGDWRDLRRWRRGWFPYEKYSIRWLAGNFGDTPYGSIAHIPLGSIRNSLRTELYVYIHQQILLVTSFSPPPFPITINLVLWHISSL